MVVTWGKWDIYELVGAYIGSTDTSRIHVHGSVPANRATSAPGTDSWIPEVMAVDWWQVVS
jgi:hypothetical protein